MKPGRKAFLSLTLWALLQPLHANPQAASAPPENTAAGTTEIVQLRGETVRLWKRDSNGFSKAENVTAKDIVLPLPVLESSPQGYVRIALSGRDVWLRNRDTVLQPPLAPAVQAQCGTQMSRASDALTAATRGAGEGCKP